MVPIKVQLDLSLDGRTNMGRDLAMLEAVASGQALARVYTWDGPWVSLGRFQRPEKALLAPAEIQWVMRPTGGKAVLHGHDVTVSIAASLIDLGVTGNKSTVAVYRAIVGPLVLALNDSGIDAVLADRTAHVRNMGHTADCFAHVSPNDIVDPRSGEKVCGCALRVTEAAALVQASIPVESPLVEPDAVFDAPSLLVRKLGIAPSVIADALKTKSLI